MGARKEMKRIQCQNCGKEFEVAEWLVERKKFCSRRCADLYKRRRVKRVCLNCGKEFEVWRSAVGKGYGKFCSRRCCGEFQRRREKVRCLNCGREFEVYPYEARKGKKFCSRECYRRYCRSEEGRERYSEMGKAAWRDVSFAERMKVGLRRRVKRVCLNCGKEFEVWRSRGEVAKFCSFDCYKQYKNREEGVVLKRKRKRRVKVVCIICGKEFEVWECMVKKGYGKFCSRECYYKYMKVSEEWKEIKSRKMKNYFQDPKFREMVIKRTIEACDVKPNGLEKAFCGLLQSYFLNEWRYVGDGKIFIAGFVPDFVHREEKWIIEVHGDYWHRFPEAVERDKKKRKAYERCGYKVLEIWEREVRLDPLLVVGKVMEYFYGNFGSLESEYRGE